MKKLAVFFLLAFNLLITGCGDNYPKIGIYKDAPKSSVYGISSDNIDSVNEQTKILRSISNMSEDELLRLHKKYRAQPNVTSRLHPKSFLGQETIDIDSYVENSRLINQKKIIDIEKDISIVESKINVLKKSKKGSVEADKKLKKLLADVDKQKAADKKRYEELYSSYFKMFSPFTDLEVGSKYRKSTNSLSSNLFGAEAIKDQRCRQPHYLYAQQVTYSNRVYCTYFLPNLSVNDTKVLYTKLSTKEKDLLKELAYLRFINRNSSIYNYMKSDIRKNNKELVNVSKQFSNRDKRELQNLEFKLKGLTKNLNQLNLSTDDTVRSKILQGLKNELVKMKSTYKLDLLLNSLSPSSEVQADGTFELNDSSDNFIVHRQIFSNSGFAVIRLNQYKDKNIVNLTDNDLISLENLLSLQLD